MMGFRLSKFVSTAYNINKTEAREGKERKSFKQKSLWNIREWDVHYLAFQTAPWTKMNEIRYYFLSTFFCVVEKWVDFFFPFYLRPRPLISTTKTCSLTTKLNFSPITRDHCNEVLRWLERSLSKSTTCATQSIAFWELVVG